MPPPSLKIVTLHRADSSGSTFLLTSHLNGQDPAGWATASVGTSITWPSVPGATAETGSGAMVKGCVAVSGCIAYIGISYQPQAASAGARHRVPGQQERAVRAALHGHGQTRRWRPSPAAPRRTGPSL